MKYSLCRIAAVVLVLLPLASGTAQEIEKVWTRPKCMDNPRNVSTTYSCWDKDGEVPWIVISDRSNNYTYSEASNKAIRSEKPIEFGDFFYVVEARGNWLHIISSPDLVTDSKGKIKSGSTFNDRGWVSRNKVLQWTSALQDTSTSIHLKVFSVHRLEDAERILKGKKDALQIYSSPTGSELLSEPKIYQFYFVYKEEGEPGKERYLIGTEYKLGSSIRRTLLGWVQKSSVIEWKTRIAMEPNFEEQAFAERKAIPDFQLVAYDEFIPAVNHARQGAPPDGGTWAQDPAKISSAELAKADPRRFKGSVVRFPLFEYNEKDKTPYFETGLIGDIKIRTTGTMLDAMEVTQYSVIEERLNNLLQGKQNLDIMLLIEGTLSMQDYRSGLKDALPEIVKKFPSDYNVRLGVALYRDSPVGQGKLFEIRNLKSTVSELQTFLSNAEFDKMGDNDDWTALYKGLDETLAQGDFSPEHTNLIFVIGNFGDFSRSATRKRDAENQNDPAIKVKREELVERLAKLDVHLFAIQPKHLSENTATDAFSSQMCGLIQQSATKQQQKFVQLFTGEGLAGQDVPPIVNPTMPSPTDLYRNDFRLQGGSTIGRFLRAPQGDALSRNDIVRAVSESTGDVVEFQKTLEKSLTRIIRGEALDSISVGALEREAIQRILLDVGGKRDVLIKLTKEKYKFYTRAFFPEQIKGARFPTFSFVLFMPEEDLSFYIRTLARLGQANNQTPDEKRESLYKVLTELVRLFSGNWRLGDSEADDVTLKELYNKYLQGISDQGLDLYKRLGMPRNFKIEDVLASKKVNDTEIAAIIRRINEHTEKLQEIKANGRRYEFAYESEGQRYYWIPIEYTF